MKNIIIIGTGKYLPSKKIKNNFFINNKFFNKNSKEYIKKIIKITGIYERRYISKKLSNSDIGFLSAKLAIEDSNINKEDIDHIIFTHNYGDIINKTYQSNMVPSLSSKVKYKLNIKNLYCKTYDIIFGCCGWLESLILSYQLIKSNFSKNILIVASDTLSKAIDPYNVNSMMFADGSGSTMVSYSNNLYKCGILYYNTFCYNGKTINYVYNGKSINKRYNKSLINININTNKIYKFLLTNVPKIIKKSLDKLNINIINIKKILIHQTSIKVHYNIIKNTLLLYKINKYDKYIDKILPNIINKTGNVSVASLPILFDMLLKNKLNNHIVKPNDIILFISMGVGFNINIVVYKIPLLN